MKTGFVTLAARDLLQESRRPWNHLVRVVSVVAVVGLSFGRLSRSDDLISLGQDLLRSTLEVLYWLIWIIAPILSVDCLSSEKRNGTLPLLFLCPLRHWQIVAGKALAHGVLSLGLVGAAIPILAVAMVAGGVHWMQVCSSAFFLLANLLLALATGLVASTVSRQPSMALFVAAILATSVAAALLNANLVITTQLSRLFELRALTQQYDWSVCFDFSKWNMDLWRSYGAPLGVLPLDHALRGVLLPGTSGTTFGKGYDDAILAWQIVLVVLVLGILWVLLMACGRHLLSEATSPSPSRSLGQIVSLGLADPRRKRSRAFLDRNPSAWLEWRIRSHYRRSLFIALTTVIFLLVNPFEMHWASRQLGLLTWIVCLLVLFVVAAAKSIDLLHSEIEAGSLELLLVTPLEWHSIVRGKIRRVLCELAPGVVVLVVLAAYRIGSQDWQIQPSQLAGGLGMLLSGVAGIPLIGMSYAMRRGHSYAKTLVCLATSVAPAWALTVVFPWPPKGLMIWSVTSALAEFVVIVLAWKRLKEAFTQRIPFTKLDSE